MEDYYIPIFYAGLIILGLAVLWLLVAAFRTHWWWVIPPLPLAYPLVHRRRAAGPLLAGVFGLTVGVFPAVYSRLVPIDLGPRERPLKDGGFEIELTKWDRKDYSFLRGKPDTVILYLNFNDDVTDETLEFIKGMKKLKDLDLGHTRITDKGLLVLKELPALRSLRLQNTKITDEGFRSAVAPLDKLEKLDLTGTKVKPATGAAWESAKPNRYLDQ